MSQEYAQSIRLLIVDDHELVRTGLKTLLGQHAHLQVVGEVGSGEEAIQKALQLKPDVVLMDIRMPGMSGIDACRQIVERLPATQVIMLTTYAEDELLLSAIRAGAKGYVLKRIGNDDMLRTIEKVARGEVALDSSLLNIIFREVIVSEKTHENSIFNDLSNQELRVLSLISDGHTNREIAAKLFLGEGTVRNYVSSLLSKLSLSNRAEAAAFAVQHHVKDHLKPE